MSSYNHYSLTPGTLKVCELSSGKARGQGETESPSLKRQHNKQSTKIKHRSGSLKNARGVSDGDLFTSLKHVVEGQESLGDFSKNKGAHSHHLSHLPPSLDIQTSVGTSTAANTLHLAS